MKIYFKDKKVELAEKYSIEEMNDNLGLESTVMEKLENKLERHLSAIEDLKKFSNSNLTDEDFFKKSLDYYDFYLEESDQMAILGGDKNSINRAIIGTSLYSTDYIRVFSDIKVCSNYNAEIMYLNSTNLNLDHIYTYDELKELSLQKKIFITKLSKEYNKKYCVVSSPQDKLDLDKHKDIYSGYIVVESSEADMPNDLRDYFLFDDMTINDYDKRYYPEIICLVKKQLAKEMISSNINQILDKTKLCLKEIKNEIDTNYAEQIKIMQDNYAKQNKTYCKTLKRCEALEQNINSENN